MIRHSLDEGLREPHAWLSRSRRFLRQSISGLLFYMEFLTITTALLAALLTAAYWNQHQQRYAALDRTVAVRAAAHRLQFGFAEGQASIQLLLADPHAGDGERQKAIALLRAAIGDLASTQLSNDQATDGANILAAVRHDESVHRPNLRCPRGVAVTGESNRRSA
jgi:hypothetical protein